MINKYDKIEAQENKAKIEAEARKLTDEAKKAKPTDKAWYKGDITALDTDKNRHLALTKYLESDGSIERTYKALEHEGFTRSLIIEWEQEEGWFNHLKDLRKRITGQIISEISIRKRNDIVFLESAKQHLVKGIIGEKGEDGEWIEEPLKPKSLEAACNAVVKLMQYQHELIKETTDQAAGRGQIVPVDVTTGNPINIDAPAIDNALLFNVIGAVMEENALEKTAGNSLAIKKKN